MDLMIVLAFIGGGYLVMVLTLLMLFAVVASRLKQLGAAQQRTERFLQQLLQHQEHEQTPVLVESWNDEGL